MNSLRHIPMTRAPRNPLDGGWHTTAGEAIVDTSRVAQERRGCIRVWPSGRHVDPLALRARDVEFRDIAHHLSLICRYTGGSPVHYSVGQHSLLVADRLREWSAPETLPELELAGLLHDAGEYVFNDIASPVKHDPRMKWYRDLEHETTRMIFCVAGIDPMLLPATKAADDAVFRDEAATFFGDADLVHPCPDAETIERQWLHRFITLHRSLSK